jgi:hypothetical protein
MATVSYTTTGDVTYEIKGALDAPLTSIVV